MKIILAIALTLAIVGCRGTNQDRAGYYLMEIGVVERLIDQGFETGIEKPGGDSSIEGHFTVKIGKESLGPIGYSGISINLSEYLHKNWDKITVKGITQNDLYVALATVQEEELYQKYLMNLGSGKIEFEISRQKIKESYRSNTQQESALYR